MPKNNEATVKLNADISQLQSQMQKASRTIKLANAEFKTAAAGMDKWSASEEGLKAKLKQLNTVLGAQKTQLDLLEKELEDTIKLNGENSAAADQMRLRVEGQKAAIANTEKQIRKYDQELDVVTGDLDKTGKEMDDVTKSSDKASDGFTVMKGALADLVASGIKAAITGLKNLAKAAMEAYEEFDKGSDAVIKATGATGEAAKELTENYNNVAHNVVGDMETIGSALGEVSTRFGMTGKELEDTTEDFLKFADITGTDATEAVRLVSRALENSGMDAKEYKKLLDILAKAGQTTGVSVTNLAEAVTKNGATFRQLGYTTEESVAMLAKFEKEGVNSETVVKGLATAVKQWGKDGKNAKEEYKKALDEIERTEDVTEATQKAIEIFGSKAGPELVEDIQAGKLEYQDFLDVLKDSTGTVTDTYEATQDGFDKIKLAIQGGKADLGAFVKDLATEYQDDIVAFIDKVKKWLKDAIKWVVQNGGLIIETIKSIAKVLATLWAVKKAAAFANTINGVITAIKGMATAAQAASTATSALSGASGILASLVSPGGAIVLGITAIVAVTASLISIFKEEKKEIDVLTDAQKESIEASHNMKVAYDEMDATRKENMATVNSEFGYYQELLKEFDSIVGANGEVKKGYEDRAQFIMTTLNEALGMEMKMQDGIIENYAKERQSINELLETKKAEAILMANEAAYTEAIQKKTEAATVYTKAQETFNDVLKAAEEQAIKVNAVNMEMARIEREEGVEAAQDYIYSQQEVFDTYQQLKVEVTNTRAALQEATDAYQGYNETIQNYEGLSAAIIGGDSQKINDALLKTEAGFKTATSTTADQLKKQRDQYKENYDLLKKAVESGDKTVTQQMVDDAKKLSDLAEQEYQKSGKNTVAGYAKGLKDDSHYAEEAAKQMGYDSYEDFNKALGINSPSTKTYQSGEYFAQGFLNGMDSKESAIYQKAKQLAQQAIKGLKDGQKEGSPSKITTQSGIFFTEGFMKGIGSMSEDLIDTIQDMVKAAIKSVGSSDVIRNIQKAGKQLMADASVPLNLGNVSDIKASVAQTQPSGAVNQRTSTINNNYNLVQNNTSPKALSALETYQARRQQLAMIKAMM